MLQRLFQFHEHKKKHIYHNLIIQGLRIYLLGILSLKCVQKTTCVRHNRNKIHFCANGSCHSSG